MLSTKVKSALCPGLEVMTILNIYWISRVIIAMQETGDTSRSYVNINCNIKH